MPRKARPQQIGVNEAIQQIDAFRQRSSLSVLSLSKLCGVSQPALARFLKGNRKTITSTARLVLKFIDENHERHNWHSHATIPSGIEDAVRSLWDGKPQSADLVASLIRALKPVLEIAAVRTGERIDGGTS
jgi:predicted transcriptional regulator